MKTCGRVKVQLRRFFNSAPDGKEWSSSRPCRCTPGERAPSYTMHCKMGGPQTRSGRRVGRKVSCTIWGFHSGDYEECRLLDVAV
jgi:hypothetical protein